MSFLLSFAQFVQPGVLVPALGPYSPMLVLSALAALTAVFTRSLGRQLQALAHPAFFALLLFVLAQGISVHYSGILSMVSQLSFWYIYPVFVALAVVLVADVEDLGRLVWGTVLGGQVVILVGLYALWAGLPTIHEGRAGAYGMYENHNDYTYVIILTMPFLYMLRRVESRRIVRFLLLGMMLTGVAGVMLSLSRAGILALVFEAGLLALLGTRSGWRAALGLAFLGVLGTFAVERLWQTRAETQAEYTAKDATESRLELWRAGKNMILAHPLLGVGSRRFGEFSEDYGEISHDNRGKNAHNTYIDVLACSGLAGFVPFMALLVIALRELRTSSGPRESEYFRALRLGALISLYAIMFRATSNAKAHDWSFYLLLAIALSCASLREQQLDEDEGAEEEAEDDDEPTGEELDAVAPARFL